MERNSDLWKKYMISNDFDINKFLEICINEEINFDPPFIKYYRFQEIINEKDYPDLLNIMNEPYQYRYYPDSSSDTDLDDEIEAEGLSKHDVVSQIDNLNTKLSITCNQPGHHRHKGVCRENRDLLIRLDNIYSRFPASINVYPINYGTHLFNTSIEKYLYHGTKSTNEIIRSNYLESNVAYGSYKKEIFFGRTFHVSYDYADPMGRTTNVKSTDKTKSVNSVLIMDKEDGYDFKKINMGSAGIESYVLEENNYNLLKNLRAIVFLSKNDVSNFLKNFDTFHEDMKKKLTEIIIYQFDYNPVLLKEKIRHEIQANFFTKYFKKEIIRKFINDYTRVFYNDMDAIIKMIYYFTDKGCMDEKNIDILCILSTDAVKYEILPEFIEFISSRISKSHVDVVLDTYYDDKYYNKKIGKILTELTEEKEQSSLDGRKLRKKKIRSGKKQTQSGKKQTKSGKRRKSKTKKKSRKL